MQSYPVGMLIGGIGFVSRVRLCCCAVASPFVNAPRRMKMRGVRCSLRLCCCLRPRGSSPNSNRWKAAATPMPMSWPATDCSRWLAAAMRRNELDYERWYATLPQEEADEVLRDLHVERLPLSSPDSPSAMDDPPHDKVPFSRRPRNVVLVTIESLSAEYVGAYGSTAGLTPRTGPHCCRRAALH
jgi:hypothetical protein